MFDQNAILKQKTERKNVQNSLSHFETSEKNFLLFFQNFEALIKFKCI
jgi:hypothetical protein